jgi:cytochrome P450
MAPVVTGYVVVSPTGRNVMLLCGSANRDEREFGPFRANQ